MRMMLHRKPVFIMIHSLSWRSSLLTHLSSCRSYFASHNSRYSILCIYTQEADRTFLLHVIFAEGPGNALPPLFSNVHNLIIIVRHERSIMPNIKQPDGLAQLWSLIRLQDMTGTTIVFHRPESIFLFLKMVNSSHRAWFSPTSFRLEPHVRAFQLLYATHTWAHICDEVHSRRAVSQTVATLPER